MPSKILNFSKDRLITGINIIDGMLFFTDNKTEPKKINIKKFKGDDPDVPVNHSSGTTHIYNRTFQERDITVIKEHPLTPLKTSLSSIGSDNDGTIGTGGGDVVDTGGDGYDWTDNNTDDDQYVGDDDDDITSSMTVSTAVGFGGGNHSIQLTHMLGTVSNARNLQEAGFYYTFDQAYSTPQTMVANVGNGSFKKEDPEPLQAFWANINVRISSTSTSDYYDADGLGSQSGDIYLWRMAYAKDQGAPGEVYGKVEGPILLKDNTAAATGTVSDFTVKATYTKTLNWLESVNFVAEYSDDGGLEILDQGFVVSKGYLNTPATAPTFAEVEAQVDEVSRENNVEGQEKYQFPARFGPSTLDRLGQMLGTIRDNSFTANAFTMLTPGYTYYVYAYMQTSNQTQGTTGTVITATPASFITSPGGDTVQVPLVKHDNTFAYETYVELEAEVVTEGDQSTQITEKGFIVSSNPNAISDGARMKEAFPNLVANADGSSQESAFSDYSVFKITSNDTLVNGKGPFKVSTNNILTLTGGQDVYYMAYAKNGSGGIGYGSEGGYNTGGVPGVIRTIDPEDTREPVITLNEVAFKNQSDEFKLYFDYNISFIPNGKTVTDSGVAFSMPTGSEIATYIDGFKTHNEVDTKGRKDRLDSSQFTFVSAGDSTALGTYTIEEYSYDLYSEADKQLFIDALNWEFDLTYFLNPLSLTLTSYAYVTLSDGTTTVTPLRVGADTHSSSSGFDWGMDSGASSLNMSFAPTVQTRNNQNQIATDVTNTSLKLEGRFGDNSAAVNTPMNELGFYYSTTDKPNIPPETFGQDNAFHEALDEWIAKGTTIKATVTITSTMADHAMGFRENAGTWFEFDKSITGLTAGSDVHFVAYAKPRQRSTQGMFAIPMFENLNRNNYGVVVTQKLVAAHTTPQSGETPRIAMGQVSIGANNSNGTQVTFRGDAAEKANYYSITKKGFYYKLKSIVGASASSSDIKTAMGSATNRNQLVTSNFVTGATEYAISGVIPDGEYYVSAFCEINCNGNDIIYISDNFKTFDVSNNTVPQDTTPKLRSDSSGRNFPRVLRATIIGNNIEIADRGFYIIGKSGTDLSQPATGSALKSTYDSPPSGVIIHKITGAIGNSVFQKVFSDQKRGYTYYYAAYATNNAGEEGISENVVKFYDQENIDRFIQSDLSLIDLDGNGFHEMPGAVEVSGGDSILVRIRTENGYDGNWEIASMGNFNGTTTPIVAYKRIYNGEAKLAVPAQSPNGMLPRVGTILIRHGSDSSLTTTVRLYQKGSNLVKDDVEPFPPIGYDFPQPTLTIDPFRGNIVRGDAGIDMY